MHTLISHDWSFALLPLGSSPEEARKADWAPVDLPHDWLIADTSDLYRDGDGWYRRTVSLSKDDLSGHVFLSFDGVYMDADILLNGRLLFTEHYGYAPFLVELTPFAYEGENELLVHVRHHAPNSRWYSGAGIYRDVELLLLPETCFYPDSIYAQPVLLDSGAWQLSVHADILGPSPQCRAVFRLYDGTSEIVSACAAAENGHITATFVCPSVQPWSPASPHCYQLRCLLGTQEETITIGFRSLSLDPDHGLFLNGEQIKLHGVCLHHDLGCLGAAFHAEAARRQLLKLAEIGVNAVRTSHNPPARQFLELCDALGILVMDEAFDMWEISKTPYDYARFFSAHAAEDLARMVRRDRNHPSVIFWSIGNEIPDTHSSPKAPQLTRYLRDTIRRYDPGMHAFITMGSNYMPWEGAQKCADVLKIAGYNYGENLYAKHHQEHPDWVILGSETASILSSRGIYHFPINTPTLSEEDEQCSALGNSSTGWGHQNLAKMLADDLTCPYSLGQFVWAGIDYIGEPTPYHTRSCYFGLFDTACFPKDSAWQYRSAWTNQPFVHIGVHWSWNPGQIIDVPVMTNLPSAELFLGERSLGVKEVDVRSAEKGLAVWHVPYAPEELRVRAWNPSGPESAQDLRRPFLDSASLLLTREESAPGSLAFFCVQALDRNGHPVENAVDLVTAHTEGPVRILGMDNGDSTDRDGYQTVSKRLFSGRLLLVLQALSDSGTATLRVSAPGLTEQTLQIPLGPDFHGEKQEGQIHYSPVLDSRIYAREVLLTPLSDTHLTPAHPSVTFQVQVLPENSFQQEISFRVTTKSGIDSPCAKVETGDNTVTVSACGDGDLFLRASVKNGDSHARILSRYEIHLEGFGAPCLNPYGFISGGLYDLHEGEITPGNEHGFAFARDGSSMVGFSNIDFGPVGSDRITIPIFALDSGTHEIDLYTGIPGKGGERLMTLTYAKPSIWNVYQPESWTLPHALTGIQTLCFVSATKFHVRGFSFEKQSRAWKLLKGCDADTVWGDRFIRDGDEIRDIGNNVTLTFSGLDFGSCNTVTLTLTGRTPLEVQPVTVHVRSADGQETSTLCSFHSASTPSSQSFPLSVPGGLCEVSLLFLPGSNFTFSSMQLKSEKEDGSDA